MINICRVKLCNLPLPPADSAACGGGDTGARAFAALLGAAAFPLDRRAHAGSVTLVAVGIAGGSGGAAAGLRLPFGGGRRSVRRKNGGTVGGRLFCRPRPPAVSPGGAAGSGKGYHPRAPIASYGFVTLTGTVQCGNRYRLLHSAVRPAVSSSSIRLILVFDRQVPSSSPPQQ